MLQLLLEDLPFGDVVDGADHPKGLTSLPTNHFAPAVDPAQLSTRPHYTMFEVVGLVFVVRCVDSLPEQIPVVWVHRLDQRLEGRSELARLEAVDAEGFIRPPHLARAHIPLPGAEVRHPLALGQAGLAPAYGPFRLLALGHVENDTLPV